MSDDRPKDCITRTAYAGGAGLAFGLAAGGIVATWADVPLVIRNQAWPAFRATGREVLNGT